MPSINNICEQVDWDTLLDDISENNLIPIIGNEIFEFHNSNTSLNIDNYLSNELLQYYGLNNVTSIPLAEAVSFIVQKCQIDISKIIRQIKGLLEQENFEFPILNHLLEIKEIGFYLNTSIFNILEKKIRASTKKEVVTANLSLISNNGQLREINNFIFNKDKVLVFNVFGSLNNSPDPALTEEEMLEYTTTFLSRMSANADVILDHLKTKSLLFIGCGQPEWLIRFFLRVVANERLYDWQRRRNKILIVNKEVLPRKSRFDFLRDLKTEIFEGDISSFVFELANRWKDRNTAKTKPKLIFLSYTEKDRAAVEKLKSTIETLNTGSHKVLTFWYDKEKLFSGDSYTNIIIQNILGADLFVPILSENCRDNPDKYFAREWEWAYNKDIIRRDSGVKGKFIFPIAVDNVDLKNDFFARYFSNVTIERVFCGAPNDDFLSRLKLELDII